MTRAVSLASAGTRKAVGFLGMAGNAARGAVFAVADVLIIVAAVRFDPDKAQDLDGSLRKIATTPLGPWLLAAVALGLAIFGIYSYCMPHR